MKQFISGFFLLTACGFGPIVLAIVYLILQQHADVQILTVPQVCTGIFSLTVLAFLAGGMNAIYRIERLPLMMAILIHGAVLYTGYLCTYLLNDWLKQDAASIWVFSGIFVFGFFLIWGIIYAVTKRKTARLNAIWEQRQRNLEDL